MAASCSCCSCTLNLHPALPPNGLQGSTQPPARLTERDLLSKMEAYGIGTDATTAEHISKQIDRWGLQVLCKHRAPA
jgi:hypothetical protein